MAQIDVLNENDQVILQIQADQQGGPAVRVELQQDAAAQLGAALLGKAGDNDVGSLFGQAQMMALHNPKFEVQRSDDNKLLIALKPDGLRPIIVQFNLQAAQALTEAIDALNLPRRR